MVCNVEYLAVFICHLHNPSVFFGEVAIQDFSPLFNGLFSYCWVLGILCIVCCIFCITAQISLLQILSISLTPCLWKKRWIKMLGIVIIGDGIRGDPYSPFIYFIPKDSIYSELIYFYITRTIKVINMNFAKYSCT